MKKSLFVLLCLVLGTFAAKAQIFVEGLPLDSVHRGEYLIVEFSSEVNRKCFVLIESDQRIDREPFSRGDWMTDASGKRKWFETRTAALNFIVEQGWDVAFVLTSDRWDDNRLLLRRKI
ncbi:MAG: hypothetical protein ACK4Q5_05105 [Saprospiraceae bacterium]